MAEHAKGTTEVFATPSEVMAVVADFEAYPEWVANLEEVEVLARDLRLRTPMGKQAYTLAYRYQPRDAGMSWTYLEGTLEDLAGSYTLEPADDDATKVTYRLEIALGMPIPGFLMRQASKQIVRSALGDLKRRVESM